MSGSTDTLELHNVRRMCVSIARNHISPLHGRRKSESLDLIMRALQVWAREQAAPDGTIEFEAPRLLNQAIRKDAPKRRRVADLQPWQCSGGRAECDADLFGYLSYVGYKPVQDVDQRLGYGVAIALLLERDGMTMPIESIVRAVDLVLFSVYHELYVYSSALAKLDAREADRIKQRAYASALAATKKRTDAEGAKAEWRAIAAGIWNDDPTQKKAAVAAMVCDVLRDREHEKVPSRRTVEDTLTGMKSAIALNLARAVARSKRAT